MLQDQCGVDATDGTVLINIGVLRAVQRTCEPCAQLKNEDGVNTVGQFIAIHVATGFQL